MLGWILLGALVGAAVIITVEVLREVLQEKRIEKARVKRIRDNEVVLKVIESCSNRYSYGDLVHIEGEASDELDEGDVIYA